MADLTEYGFTPDMLPENFRGIPARITAVHRERYELICEAGDKSGRLKSTEYYVGGEEFPTAGDFVLIDNYTADEVRIIRTLPRKSCFKRLDPSSSGHGEQAVAANFDYVFILQSLNNDFNIRRLERYLTLAWQSGALPVVLLTKSDLTDRTREYMREAEKTAVGVGVFPVSAVTGDGLDELSGYLKPGKTVVLLGSSGVGKSSLVNALAGRRIMDVSGIREDDSRGRHTTTYRQLIRLDSGVMIIDTPGMRELGMWDVSGGLEHSFTDVEEYIGQCRFGDCSHNGEPGCAVAAAISSGMLSAERWQSYCNLKKEAVYSEDKEAYMVRKKEWHKSIAVKNRSFKKNKY